METESIQVLLHRNGFDKTIHDFENFTRKVFNGSDEIQKKNLHKKLEEFTTFREFYENLKRNMIQKNCLIQLHILSKKDKNKALH